MTTDSPSLDVLVLGGTSWLGGAVARHAQERGHRVTCLARGRSGAAPDGVRLLPADRDQPDAYRAVADGRWDFVVDVARQPLHVQGAVDALRGTARHFVFVSTCSVYSDDTIPGADESAALHEPWEGDGLAPDEAYGPAKVTCERIVLESFPEALVARAGLIIGYGDRSDRFGYWPNRFARAADGERILGPTHDHRTQLIDVVDLAGWLVACGEDRAGGVVNALGDGQTLGDVYRACAEATGVRPVVAEAPDAWLSEHAVEPWMGPDSLPLWLPQPEYAGFMGRSNAAARRLGLRFRPLLESTRDALAWERQQGLDRPRHAGLSKARENELLEALYQRR